MILGLLATLCAGLFAGSAIYINLVEHPARMSLGANVALTEWAPAYHRGTIMQVPLAMIGLLAALAAWGSGSGLGWLVGGLMLGSVIPFTLIVIFPTNKQLLDPATAQDVDRVHQLLGRWNRLHSVRSLLSMSAFVVFLALLR